MLVHYSCLKKQEFSFGDYSLVPIRYEDRFLIMKWRNEQIYHLRQGRPLTEEDQQRYFDNVVAKLYDNPQPDVSVMVAWFILTGLTTMRRFLSLWTLNLKKNILPSIGATILPC